ncbi:hypothetical protein BOQ60_26690, partial [Chryseobacterium sp. CH1]
MLLNSDEVTAKGPASTYVYCNYSHHQNLFPEPPKLLLNSDEVTAKGPASTYVYCNYSHHQNLFPEPP